MARMAGVEMTAVPYRGGPEALTDVIAGRIDSTFTDFPAGMPQIREGKVRALAVTTAARLPADARHPARRRRAARLRPVRLVRHGDAGRRPPRRSSPAPTPP